MLAQPRRAVYWCTHLLVMMIGGPWWSGISAAEPKDRPLIQRTEWHIDRETGEVIITYDLLPPPKGTVDVSVELRKIGDGRFSLVPKGARGHLGDEVCPGKGRRVTWWYERERPKTLSGGGWYFILTASGIGLEETATSNVGSFTPPELHIGALVVSGPFGPGELKPGEEGEVSYAISNTGVGTAAGVTGRLVPTGPVRGLSFNNLAYAGEILPGGAARCVHKIVASDDTPTQKTPFTLVVSDSARNDSTFALVEIHSVRWLLPDFTLGTCQIRPRGTSVPSVLDRSTTLFAGDTVTVLFEVLNTGQGPADSALVTVDLTGNGLVGARLAVMSPYRLVDMSMDQHDVAAHSLGLRPGDKNIVQCDVVTDRTFDQDTLSLAVRIDNRRPDVTRTFTLPLPVRNVLRSFDGEAARLTNAGEYDSLLSWCSTGMRLMPDSAAPLLYMARVAERRGDPAGGRRFYEKAAERGSVVARGWLTREENQQQSRIRYRTLRPNPFRMAKRDAGIAILSFTDARGRSSDFGEQLYAALTRYKVSERFPIYDYGELAKLKSSDIRSLQPTDRTSMKALGERLRIEFVVSGRVHDPRRNHFTLRVTRTSDGSMIVEQEYRDVNEATAFADVARLFTEGVVPDRRER